MNFKTIIKKALRKLSAFYDRKIDKCFRFEVQLADHCNLNCIGCSHFSPIADEHFLDVDNYRKDCKKLAELAKKYVREISLMGGEPLMHKDIVDIIEITRNNFEKSIIEIVTNGILLDRMGSEFWNACKRNNVIISITHYPINLNVSKICELALQFEVNVENRGNNYKMKFRKDVLDSEGSQNKKESFKKCGKTGCHHLSEGKFYMCPIPAYIKYFNKQYSKKIYVATDDYIDIHQTRNVKTLLKYIKNPIPFCRYCNIKSSNNNIIWRTSMKEISEWT